MMKKLLYLLIFLFLSSPVWAQSSNEFNARWQEAYQLAENKNLEQCKTAFNRLLDDNSEYALSYVMLSWCQLLSGDTAEADKNARYAFELGPYLQPTHSMMAYVNIAQNRIDQGKWYLSNALWLDEDNSSLQYFQQDLQDLIDYNINASAFQELLPWLESTFANRDKSYQKIAPLTARGFQATQAKNFDEAKKYYDQAIAIINNVPDRAFFKPVIQYTAAYNLELFEAPGHDFPYFEQAYFNFDDFSSAVPALPKLFSATVAAEYYGGQNNWERAYSILDGAYTHYEKLDNPHLSYFKMRYLNQFAQAAGQQQQQNLQANLANRMLQLSGTGYDEWYYSNAYNYIGMALQSNTQTRPKAAEYLQMAYDKATQNGFNDLASDILSNLAISYWQLGKISKAVTTYQQLVRDQKAEGNLIGTEASLNNLGSLFYITERYDRAAEYFTEAINITEQARQELSGANKIRFLEGKLSAYYFAINSYANLNNVSGVFDIQQKSRARVLSEALNTKSTPSAPTLAQYQSLIGPDEAAIFYSLFTAGEVIITVVTRDNAYVTPVKDFKRWVGIKAKYLDRFYTDKPGYKPVDLSKASVGTDNALSNQISRDDFNKITELLRDAISKKGAFALQGLPQSQQVQALQVRDAVMNNLLQQYYRFLIAPVEQQIAGKEKLIISPDGILNYLPFQALRDNQGTYLAEKFNVRYTPSAAVSRILSRRNYPDNRKKFLGMGGAIYQRMDVPQQTVDSRERYIELKVLAEKNALAGASQREIYAAVFSPEPMNYLPGTLEEIRNMSKIFPTSDTFEGKAMNENRIKTMSANGSLGNYEIIHLATHGFAIAQFPQLSGIAMSIFTEEVNGEDGYLTAPEIAELNMQAELVVLSACDTGLGKIYGGEGVDGMMQSLLIGGANNALVTLWPVSDQGTMYFMTGMYELTQNEGLSYADAMNVMRQRFINGEFGDRFRDPNLWAPYVLYGS